MHSSIGTQARRGLTLEQVLIFLCFLVLLALILWPVLARPHRPAPTSCVPHLKQLGNALAMYTSDYDDMLPPVGTRPPHVPERLYPYLKRRDLWTCPRDSRPANYAEESLGEITLSFGYNWLGLTDGTAGLQMDRISNQARVVSLVDAPSLWVAPGELSTWFPAGAPAYRHNDGANAVFLDGHVKWNKRDVLEMRRSGAPPDELRAYVHRWPALRPTPKKHERR